MQNKKGFTLVEILMALAIIGIIISIVFSYLDGARKKGRDAQRIADIEQLNSAIQVYFDSCYYYPLNISDINVISGCNPNKILASMPVDPQTKLQYSYARNDSPLQYHVCATLELGYVGGAGKSGKSPFTGDPCNGTASSTFDKFGPY